MISINKLDNLYNLCDDIKYEAFLIDRVFIIQEMSNYRNKVKYSEVFIKIRDINNVILIINEYMLLEFKIFDNVNDKSIIAIFTKRVYLVNNLKVKILIDNNILNIKKIILNLNKELMIINSYNNVMI